MGSSEAAHWMACLCARDLKRNVAKQLLWRWCVQGARTASNLYSTESYELIDLGLSAPQYSQFCASRSLVEEQEAFLVQLESEGIKLLTRADTAYPEALTQHLPEEHLPYLLYYRGNLDLLTLHGIALMGSGQPGTVAQAFTRDLITQLAGQECAFIGGYSKGVDRLCVETGLAAGANFVLVLPLGLRFSRNMTLILDPYLAAGKLLVLSPYACDSAFTATQAAARLPIITGLCEMLLAIEPDEAPDGWIQSLHAPLPRLGVWVGNASARHESWLARGAITISSVEEACQQIQSAMGETNAEPNLQQAGVDTCDSPIAFIDADSAIETLSQSGAVPDILARRLRERAPEWGR